MWSSSRAYPPQIGPFGRAAIVFLVGLVLALVAAWAPAHAKAPKAPRPATLIAAATAELLMFDDPACVWCKRWHDEIGGVYDSTDEGRIAPLRVLQLRNGLPSDTTFSAPVVVTPTFVLVKDGREVGRILGYPGEDLFWGLLGQELEKLPAETPAEAPLTRTRAAQ